MKNQTGRSMVEMLGVLAIIAVLSVGGLIGYSKAMFQYKLNKQMQQYTELLANMIRYDLPTNTNVAPIFKNLNLIPEGFKIKNNFLFDVFSLSVNVYYDNNFHKNLNISMNSENEKQIAICSNIIKAAQPFYISMDHIGVCNESSDSCLWYWKDAGGRAEKISKMTSKDIFELCENCKTNNCRVYIALDYENEQNL